MKSNIALITLFLEIALHCQERTLLSVKPDHTKVTANEPVVIQLTIANNGGNSITAEIDGELNDELIVSLFDSGGKRVLEWNPYSDPDGGFFGGSVRLGPGESFTKPVILNEWVRRFTPGVYRFEMGLRKTASMAAAFQIEVLPHNPERIRKTCSDLAEAILSSALQRGFHLAHVLSYAIDSEAVSSMQRVVEQRDEYAWPLMKGMVTIGDRTAIASLGVLARSTNALVSSAAKGNLGALRHATSDESLRREIDAILNAK